MLKTSDGQWWWVICMIPCFFSVAAVEGTERRGDVVCGWPRYHDRYLIYVVPSLTVADALMGQGMDVLSWWWRMTDDIRFKLLSCLQVKRGCKLLVLDEEKGVVMSCVADHDTMTVITVIRFMLFLQLQWLTHWWDKTLTYCPDVDGWYMTYALSCLQVKRVSANLLYSA